VAEAVTFMRIVFIIVILIELKSVIDNVDPSLEWIRGSLSAAMIPDHPRRRTRLTFSRGTSSITMIDYWSSNLPDPVYKFSIPLAHNSDVVPAMASGMTTLVTLSALRASV
jgi:hypothetical protein